MSNEIAINDYDNSILQADDLIGEILGILQDRGYLQNAVVVISADHGEQLGERGLFGHGTSLDGESLNVPLIIVDPTLSRAHRLPYARQIDIAPTVAACLGLSPPPSWEGESLLTTTPAESFHQTMVSQPLEAVIWRSTQGTYKYVFDTVSRSESLFELDQDPAELSNLIDRAEPGVVTPLRAARAQNFSG